MFCQSHTTNSKHNVPAVNCFQKDVWPYKKINLLKGFQKKPWPYLFWPYHSPLTQRCSTSLLCHADIWMALDVLKLFSQCYRHGIDICAFDVMQIFFLFYLPFFLPCTDALHPTCAHSGIENQSLHLYLATASASRSVLLPPSLCQDHLCLFYTFVAVGSLHGL